MLTNDSECEANIAANIMCLCQSVCLWMKVAKYILWPWNDLQLEVWYG